MKTLILSLQFIFLQAACFSSFSNAAIIESGSNVLGEVIPNAPEYMFGLSYFNDINPSWFEYSDLGFYYVQRPDVAMQLEFATSLISWGKSFVGFDQPSPEERSLGFRLKSFNSNRYRLQNRVSAN